MTGCDPGDSVASDEDQSDGVIYMMSEYIADARTKAVSDSAGEAALRCIFDLMSSAAAGVKEAAPTRLMATATLGPGTTPIWFTGISSSSIGAAWANSAAAAALDLDDGHRLARGHPGAAVIPTAFAVANETHATLADILVAIVIGYEVGVTIGASRTSYGNTGTWASFAVVATAAALRRTSPAVVAHALAIAGESAPNQLFASSPAPRMPVPEGSAVKEGIPWAVVTGLAALGLAEAGHTGPRNLLDSSRHYQFPVPLRLGSYPKICSTYFKLYACCRHIHAPLDALLDVMDRHSIVANAITAIHVETTSAALRISNRASPTNIVDVQYSIPFCLALIAVSGRQALLPLSKDVLEIEEAHTLSQKVTLAVDPLLDSQFPSKTLARVTVDYGNRRVVSDLTEPRGEADRPLSWGELEWKFRTATCGSATDAEKNSVLSAARALRHGDLSALTECMRRMTFVT